MRGGAERRFQITPTTQRLGLITTLGSTATVDHGWNDRGELTSRTTATPSGPASPTPPTIHQNGFEDPVLVSPEVFTFDRARRLMAYQDVATYQYDAHHRRVASTVPSRGTRYQVYSRAGELLYVEDAGRDERTQFFHLTGTLVAERSRPLDSETATVNYLHSDHRGTPTVKTSSIGTRVYRSRLMPYGTPYDGIYRDGPGFTKHATDEAGPWIYMQQRYFDPVVPRFISPDPDPARADNFNRYAYANNNPYTFVDPDGRESTHMLNYIMSDWRGTIQRSEHGTSLVADFTPVIGDIKGFVDAYHDPSVINFTAATIGLVPGIGDAAGKALKNADVIADAAKKFSAQKQALVDMAKSDKRSGISPEDMQAYKDLNAELPDPFPENLVRGPESHPSAASPSSQAPHGHVGPVEHIPILEKDR